MATTLRYPSSFAMAELERLPPDDPREWLNRARSSLLVAEARVEGVYLEDLCYQAQEASEKAIKAVMIAADVRFPYVHELKALLDLLEAARFLVSADLRAAAKAASRKPDERYPAWEVVTELEYQAAVAGARLLVSWAEVEVAGWRGGTGQVRERSTPSAWDARLTGSGRPDPAVLADVVDRIVATAQPERIILFGSAARGTMGPHSDLDVMVVMPEPLEHGRAYRAIREALSGLRVAVDVIVATPADLERYGRSWCLVYCPALEEGRVLYEQERGFAVTAGAAPTA